MKNIDLKTKKSLLFVEKKQKDKKSEEKRLTKANQT